MTSDVLAVLPTATDVSCPPAPEGFEHIAAAADYELRRVLYTDLFDAPADPRFERIPAMEVIA